MSIQNFVMDFDSFLRKIGALGSVSQNFRIEALIFLRHSNSLFVVISFALLVLYYGNSLLINLSPPYKPLKQFAPRSIRHHTYQTTLNSTFDTKIYDVYATKTLKIRTYNDARDILDT